MVETVQRQEPEDEEELMQGKFASGLTGTLQAKEEAPSNETGMQDHLKSGIENISGVDLSGVRVHYNSSKPKLAQRPRLYARPKRSRWGLGKSVICHMKGGTWCSRCRGE